MRQDEHASLSQLRETTFVVAPQREISSKMRRTHSSRRMRGVEGQWSSESLAMQFASQLDDQRLQETKQGLSPPMETIAEDRNSAASYKSTHSIRAMQATRHRPCVQRILTSSPNEPIRQSRPSRAIGGIGGIGAPLRSLSRGAARSASGNPKKSGFLSAFQDIEEETHPFHTSRGSNEEVRHTSEGPRASHHSNADDKKRVSGCSFFSESPSMAGVGMRQKQYTLDTLDEALMYDGEVGAMPDHDQLRDQIEWDIGVYDTLHQLKQMQIREQIALDTRHQQSTAKNVSKSKSEAAAPQRRASLGDYISAAQSGGPIFSDTPSRAAKRLVGNSDNHGKRGSAGGLTPPMVGGDDGAVGRRSLFEDLADTAEMSRLRWYVVDPQRWPFQVWSILTELILFVICIIEPLRVGHIVIQNKPMNMLMIYCDVQLLLDLLLHFFVAYDDELRDIQVTSMRHIVPRYLQGNFAFDAVVALPWNILVWDETTHHVRDVLRMSKLLGAHRLLSTRSVFSNAPDAMMFNPSLITLWKMLLTILFVWHWVGCVYWLVSTHSYDAGEPYLSVKDAWSPPDSVLATNFTHVRYAYAVTWAIGVTTGGTFPSPSTMLQLFYGNLVAIVGFLLMSLVIGSATTALSDMQAQSSEVSIRLQHIDRYMRYKRLPSSIRQRIVQFYRFQYTSLNRIDENEVLVGLPRALRVQMQLIMHKQIFTQLPLFWLCSEEEILLITQRLRPCVIMPGEMLIKQDRLAVGLFLLMKGAVETLRDGELVIVLLAVAAFGENALRGTPSNCSIRALRFCETTVLLREDFAVIEQMNPVVRRWLDVYILERDRKLANPQTRRQSMETKSAAIKSVRCRDGWHTHDSKSLLSRRSGTDTPLVALSTALARSSMPCECARRANNAKRAPECRLQKERLQRPESHQCWRRCVRFESSAWAP